MEEIVDERLENEEHFHDIWAKSIDPANVQVDASFEACTCPENRYIINKLGDLQGKKVLELGCGAGEASVYFAKKGATVTATDISGELLKVVQRVASLHKVRVNTKQCYSHSLDFEDDTFDIVFAANLLHHVDIEATLKESQRVLKKGGAFVSWDPLAHNPLINIYRRIATEVRTEDEHPLRMEQLALFNKFFSNVETSGKWFFTLFIYIKFFCVDWVNPNKERYWKKVIVEHKKLEPLYNRLERLDNYVLGKMPYLQRFCWNIVVIGKK